jgi:hypothetical protein
MGEKLPGGSGAGKPGQQKLTKEQIKACLRMTQFASVTGSAAVGADITGHNHHAHADVNRGRSDTRYPLYPDSRSSSKDHHDVRGSADSGRDRSTSRGSNGRSPMHIGSADTGRDRSTSRGSKDRSPVYIGGGVTLEKPLRRSLDVSESDRSSGGSKGSSHAELSRQNSFERHKDKVTAVSGRQNVVDRRSESDRSSGGSKGSSYAEVSRQNSFERHKGRAGVAGTSGKQNIVDRRSESPTRKGPIVIGAKSGKR